MIILDTELKSLEFVLDSIITTTDLTFVSSWVDYDTTTTTPSESDGISADTTPVTLVAAPASGFKRQVSTLSIANKDSVDTWVTVSVNNNSSLRRIIKVKLSAGDSLFYDNGQGWYVITDTGGIKGNSGGMTHKKVMKRVTIGF